MMRPFAKTLLACLAAPLLLAVGDTDEGRGKSSDRAEATERAPGASKPAAADAKGSALGKGGSLGDGEEGGSNDPAADDATNDIDAVAGEAGNNKDTATGGGLLASGILSLLLSLAALGAALYLQGRKARNLEAQMAKLATRLERQGFEIDRLKSDMAAQESLQGAAQAAPVMAMGGQAATPRAQGLGSSSTYETYDRKNDRLEIDASPGFAPAASLAAPVAAPIPPPAPRPLPTAVLGDLARQLTDLAADPATKTSDHERLVGGYGELQGVDFDSDTGVFRLSESRTQFSRVVALVLQGGVDVALVPSARFVTDFAQTFKETLEAGADIQALYDCHVDGSARLVVGPLATGKLGPDGVIRDVVTGRLAGFIR